MRIYKNRCTFCLFLTLIILSSGRVFFPINNSSFEPISEGHDALNLSDNELVINTPENITYTGPMNGYYPGTYGFEDEIVGETNEDIRLIDTDSSSAESRFEIISDFQNHNNVLKCIDGPGISRFQATHYFDNVTSSGTVEFWYAIDNVGIFNGLNLRFFGDGIHAFYINCYHGYFRVRDWVSIGVASANTWYHIKLEYDCTLHEVKYYIDGEYKKTDYFEEVCTQIEYMVIESDYQFSNLFNGYLDAIGFDWENGYDIGDNKHEGLLLSYDESISFDWVGYSFDNAPNKTIFGNSTIPMPYNGTHSIQLFGNNSLGDMFQSEKRYFTTHYNSIDIITPENITYTAPMSGYYPGTYGFENDQNGDIPEGWIDYHSAIGCAIEVIDEKYGHRKVVELSDNHNVNIALMESVFKTPRPIGTIEFWIATTNAGKGTFLSFMDAPGYTAFKVEIVSDKIKFLYQGLQYIEYGIEDGQWRHVRIDFNCVTDKMTYWLDGVVIGPDLNFYQAIDNIEKIWFNTDGIDSAYSSYIDAIGYSWDSYYRIGDNYDEGILFSYENYVDLDWKEFSLDSQPRQSILGNKTLPVPVDGMHSIQFFAQDSLGDYYESDLRFFTVEIAPSVEWVTPGDGSTVILPFTKPPNENDGLFTFQYTYRRLDDIELEIDGTNLGSVWNATSIVLTPYTDYTDGFLSATLIGINNSMIVDSDTRSFQFVKIEDEVTETLNSSTEVLGKQLYLILHDPHGDNSFSSISESTSLSIGVGCELAIATGFSLEIGEDVDLCYVEVGGSALLSFKTTLSLGFDFRYEITDTTSLTSSQVTDDADYIGPGYGDRYWGESWLYKWVLNGTYREYSNGTNRWEKPQLHYGILRDLETFISDEHAPQEWRNQNAVYNSSIPVQWESPFFGSGGAPYLHEREVSATTTRKISLQIDFGSNFRQKYGIVETHVTIDLSLKIYAEVVLGNTHKVAYEIYDDDPSDYIVQGRGIDQRFGTYLFNSTSFFCETSDPLEHNTYDYLPPVIDFPTINFDTNNDNFGPANDDSPLVRVNIFDEGGLQAVSINYTINNGLNWNLISLHELIASPGLWEGTIPSLTQGTKVKWYIIAWDSQGNRAERKDIYGNPFEYTVLEKPIVPSYPPMFIIVSLMTPIVAIILRNLKKLNKINT